MCQKIRLTFHVPPELAEKIRDAVVRLPGQTMDGFGETALRVLLDAVASTYNAGRSFPARQSGPRKGRPPLSADVRKVRPPRSNTLAKPAKKRSEAKPRFLAGSASASKASSPAPLTNNYRDFGAKLVEPWPLNGGPDAVERQRLIQAASGCMQRAVDRCFLTPLEAYTGLKTYQDAYFESPLFNSGKGYSPLRWFEDDLYLEDLNNWKTVSTEQLGTVS